MCIFLSASGRSRYVQADAMPQPRSSRRSQEKLKLLESGRRKPNPLSENTSSGRRRRGAGAFACDFRCSSGVRRRVDPGAPPRTPRTTVRMIFPNQVSRNMSAGFQETATGAACAVPRPRGGIRRGRPFLAARDRGVPAEAGCAFQIAAPLAASKTCSTSPAATRVTSSPGRRAARASAFATSSSRPHCA